MKRTIAHLVLAAAAACLFITQVGCADSATAASNVEGVKKPVDSEKGKNEKTEGVQAALEPK